MRALQWFWRAAELVPGCSQVGARGTRPCGTEGVFLDERDFYFCEERGRCAGNISWIRPRAEEYTFRGGGTVEIVGASPSAHTV